MIVKQAVGIDIAKDKFDVCFSLIDNQQKVTIKSTRKFSNTPAGIGQLDSWLVKHAAAELPLVLVMEATGVYYEQLAWHLHLQARKLSVVLPSKAKRYAHALGLKSKNDAIDAKALSRMAAEQQLALWQPVSGQLYALRALNRELERLQHQKTQLSNQLHALEHSRIKSKSSVRRIKQQLALLDKQVEEVEQEVKTMVEQDAVLKGKIERLMAIKGVGLISVVTVVAETDGFALMKNHRQLVSYSGYDVVENQSGSRTGKTRMSKKGNSRIRRILHLPAFNVVRYEEPVFKALHERLIARGKTKMQAYVAVQKKLLVLFYTLWKKEEAYQAGRGLQEAQQTSGKEEPRLLFSAGCAADKREVAPAQARATQDELPENESPEVLFSAKRRYRENHISALDF